MRISDWSSDVFSSDLADYVDALVLDAPRALAEALHPQIAQVEVPVVLAGDEQLLDRYLLQQLGAELELQGVAELGEVAAEAKEVGRRVHLHHFLRSEEKKSELQSLMRITYAGFCLKKINKQQ